MPDARRLVLRAALKLMAVGLAAAVGYVFLSAVFSRPPESIGGERRVDLAELREERALKVHWRGRDVWVLHRSDRMRADIERPAAPLKYPGGTLTGGSGLRSADPRYFVALASDTASGCELEYIPWRGTGGEPWRGGFRDPCAGSRYDFAGRVLADAPAVRDLDVPAHRIEGGHLVLLGD